MIASQYQITLPSDYNMDIIIKRVEKNGYKTDNFFGLDYKFYLITKKDKNNNSYNSYSPLYLWKTAEGLNKFLFEGAYDNIINSFGNQKVNIGIPLLKNINNDLSKVIHIVESYHQINADKSLNNFKHKILENIKYPDLDYVVIYNPDKWVYVVFYFLFNSNNIEFMKKNNLKIYDVLHVSNYK
ncbi:MAG: DUF4865 family protein [Sarcina sp.]